ncbi:MAG: type III polyketide synthase [Hymenobacteraceae bacterium]|nr:type III polyketide synthase [Hymenobacteraceae bacterium]MDX5397386.1 type III polyketide synthase [Hymenobacteraceae bacterium]MDX5513464.1 type III polyketide synthase [Hymenobacteraceae bacterium]
MTHSYICAIGTATPATRIPQVQIADFMAEALEMDEAEKRKLKVLYRVSGIDYRHTVIPDFARQNGSFTFFPNTPGLEPFPTVQQRMEIYRKEALPLSVAAVKDCLQQTEAATDSITHLITVSCTGMYAPGLDIELVETLGLPTTTQRTSVNFMGCYAAFNALKLADAICRADGDAKVLVVCTELCTTHFQKRHEQDHLLSNALFSDGAAAVLLQAQPQSTACLRLDRFYCDLISQGKQEMAWHIGDLGFEMTLSSYVPGLIQQGIGRLTDNLLQQLQLSFSDVNLFAIHPGGRRILEAIEKELGLTKEHNKHAYNVLKNYGNMSSVTVLFVLKSLLEDLKPEQHEAPVISCAFGPGLTLESMLLQVHYADANKVSVTSEAAEKLNLQVSEN